MSHLFDLYIRADASSVIGLGHIYRTLVFAKYVMQHGAKVYYFCRAHDNYDYNWLLEYGVEIYIGKSHNQAELDSVENNAGYKSWLGTNSIDDSNEFILLLSQSPKEKVIVLVDHYGVDFYWENRVKQHCNQLITISDIASRTFSADMIVDPTFNRLPQEYLCCVKYNTQVLTGASMCFIDNRFLELKNETLNRRFNVSAVDNILVMFGGSDPLNLTSKLLDQLIDAEIQYSINVVIGAGNQCKNDIENKYSNIPFITLHFDSKDMPKLTSEADLAIGGAGSACWERAVLGVPSIIVPFESNQLDIAHSLDRANAAEIVYLEQFSSLSERIVLLCENHKKRKLLTKNSSIICDGQGPFRLYTKLVDKYV
ncbi:hypothetical protein PS1M3_23100 [Pseudoalteromonas sp. PS1M3]|uniref:UDP-2,4-diacetamido-2,4, 6-trideoxy-beta-L-altropyranose hydrolase n=1 Tax=Pseudoalteromonas sp. PS1M3 TaxID=87791 RepID=UPI00194F99D1|nr:UDP-2,4-diacetamido-2,4,6-trideoxy-beta-L-altropyranose hydrolase [Pseudoalteromonas sp. PS1M3]BBW92223.1 hypothetical protein PS1M3_23100 [Pseudoalteromonas sp. PS1M3]